MIIVKIDFECSDRDFTRLCEQAEKDGVYKACGNPDKKWIMLRFETELQKIHWLYKWIEKEATE
jgi:hypothetical protein